MAMYSTLFILLMHLILSVAAADEASRNENLVVAIGEMQKANYFTFIMLINMSPPDRLPGNITFLMPNDRMLSKITLSQNMVSEFLLWHSIPSPLLFDHLKLLPTGSTIPSSEPNFMLRISNNGRRNFYLNNVKLISPNICTAGSSIRCHGIDGVLMTTEPEQNTTLPSGTCPSAGPQIAAAPITQSSPSTPPSPLGPLNLTPTVAPPPVDANAGSQKTGASGRPLAEGIIYSMTTWMTLSLVGFQLW